MAKPLGSFSNAMYDSIRMAEQMQAMSLQYLHSQFESEPEVTSIADMTWETYVNELETLGVDEFNLKYSQLIQPFIELAMQPQQGEV